jgi:hypothetical protein
MINFIKKTYGKYCKKPLFNKLNFMVGYRDYADIASHKTLNYQDFINKLYIFSACSYPVNHNIRNHSDFPNDFYISTLVKKFPVKKYIMVLNTHSDLVYSNVLTYLDRHKINYTLFQDLRNSNNHLIICDYIGTKKQIIQKTEKIKGKDTRDRKDIEYINACPEPNENLLLVEHPNFSNTTPSKYFTEFSNNFMAYWQTREMSAIKENINRNYNTYRASYNGYQRYNIEYPSVYPNSLSPNSRENTLLNEYQRQQTLLMSQMSIPPNLIIRNEDSSTRNRNIFEQRLFNNTGLYPNQPATQTPVPIITAIQSSPSNYIELKVLKNREPKEEIISRPIIDNPLEYIEM